MSFVIAVCSINFALIMSDGRKGLYDEQMNLLEISDENVKKIHRINDNVCLGFAGDYNAAIAVVENFHNYNCKGFTLETCVSIVEEYVKDIKLLLPLNLILTGRSKKGRFGLVTLSSLKGYDKEYVYPTDDMKFAVEYACSSLSANEIEDIMQRRIYSKSKDIYSLENLELRLSNRIKNIANQTPTVNKIIFKELIV